MEKEAEKEIDGVRDRGRWTEWRGDIPSGERKKLSGEMDRVERETEWTERQLRERDRLERERQSGGREGDRVERNIQTIEEQFTCLLEIEAGKH